MRYYLYPQGSNILAHSYVSEKVLEGSILMQVRMEPSDSKTLYEACPESKDTKVVIGLKIFIYKSLTDNYVNTYIFISLHNYRYYASTY